MKFRETAKVPLNPWNKQLLDAEGGGAKGAVLSNFVQIVAAGRSDGNWWTPSKADNPIVPRERGTSVFDQTQFVDVHFISSESLDESRCE